MARAARLQLADLRAMEEQSRREEMHGPRDMIGGKQFYGAGATPSMGLSQFRGGRKVVEFEPEDDEYEDDYEMEGGGPFDRAIAATAAAAARAAASRAAAAAAARGVVGSIPSRIGLPTSTSQLANTYLRSLAPSLQSGSLGQLKRGVPQLTNVGRPSTAFDINNFDYSKFASFLPKTAQKTGVMSLYRNPSTVGQYIDDVAIPPSGAIMGSADDIARTSTALTTRFSKPQLTYNAVAREPLDVLSRGVGTALTPKMSKAVTTTQLALAKNTSQSVINAGFKRLVAAGVPAALASVLMGTIMGLNANRDPSDDTFDETIDEEIKQPEQRQPEKGQPPEEEEPEPDEEEQPEETIPPEIINTLPSDLSPNELAWYLRSGNLPDRYAFRRQRKGRGKAKRTPAKPVRSVEEIVGKIRNPDRIGIPKPKPTPKPPRRFFKPTEPGMMDPQIIEEFLEANRGRMLKGQELTEEQKKIADYIEKNRDRLVQAEKEERERLLKEARERQTERIFGKPKYQEKRTMGRGVCKVGGKVSSKPDGRKARAQIVKKVMQERGIKSLAEASKIVKAEGLY